MKRLTVLLTVLFGIVSVLLADSLDRYTGPYSDHIKETCTILPPEGLLIEQWELHYDDYRVSLCKDHTHEGAEFNRSLTDRVMIVDGVRDGDKLYFTAPYESSATYILWFMGTVSDNVVTFKANTQIASLISHSPNVPICYVYFAPSTFPIKPWNDSDDYLVSANTGEDMIFTYNDTDKTLNLDKPADADNPYGFAICLAVLDIDALDIFGCKDPVFINPWFRKVTTVPAEKTTKSSDRYDGNITYHNIPPADSRFEKWELKYDDCRFMFASKFATLDD